MWETRAEEAVIGGVCRCFGTVGAAGLAENAVHVACGGSRSDYQLFCNLVVCPTCGDESEDFQLALSQAVE